MGTATSLRPAPQADRLSVVAAVVDAISAGCDTADAIADAIAMTGRQGGYYPNAAWTLGYAEPVPNTSPVQWRLTGRGLRFADLDAPARTSDLTAALLALEEMATFTEDSDGADRLALDWAQAGYSEETIARRLQTMDAWAAFLTADPNEQVTALEAAASATRLRAPAAKDRAAVAAAAKAEVAAARAKPEPVHGDLCGSCFIVMPLTGGCANCD